MPRIWFTCPTLPGWNGLSTRPAAPPTSAARRRPSWPSWRGSRPNVSPHNISYLIHRVASWSPNSHYCASGRFTNRDLTVPRPFHSTGAAIGSSFGEKGASPVLNDWHPVISRCCAHWMPARMLQRRWMLRWKPTRRSTLERRYGHVLRTARSWNFGETESICLIRRLTRLSPISKEQQPCRPPCCPSRSARRSITAT